MTPPPIDCAVAWICMADKTSSVDLYCMLLLQCIKKKKKKKRAYLESTYTIYLGSTYTIYQMLVMMHAHGCGCR